MLSSSEVMQGTQEDPKKRAEEPRWGCPCPAQPSDLVLQPSHFVGFMAPELYGTSSALPSPRSPSRTQTSPKTLSPSSAPREKHKQFGGNSWVDQQEEKCRLSLGKFPAMLGTCDGLQGPAPGLGTVWVPRCCDKVSELVLSPQVKQGGQTQHPDFRGCLLSAKGES